MTPKEAIRHESLLGERLSVRKAMFTDDLGKLLPKGSERGDAARIVWHIEQMIIAEVERIMFVNCGVCQ